MAIASRVPKSVLSTFAAAKLPEAAAAAGEAVAAVPVAPSERKVLEFEDTRRLFAGEPSSVLVRTLTALQALSVAPLVDAATAALRWPAVAGSALGRAAARATAYRHFCGGETSDEAADVVRRLWRGGMGGILDYSIEDAEDGDACDRNAAGFVAAVDVAAALPPGSASVCIKITALCPIALLEKTSHLLRWQHKHPSFVLPWKAHSFPILSDSSPLYLTASEPPALTAEEERELQLAHERLLAVGARCAEHGIPLLVDAEYATVQPAIDYFTFAGALAFNGGGAGDSERPIVHGTIQAYLRDARDRLEAMVGAAESERVRLGLKVVRGAYIARETRLAASLGVPSPIHSSIQDTHDCYNGCAAFLLDRVRRGSASVMLATHNVESGQLAAARAQELGIAKGDQNLQFAQLMGMADGLSLSLRNAGFQVSKYLPYGPVDQIIPYLIRRAEENRGLLSSSSFDRQLLRKELVRRVKAAVVGRE
ncbi:proline dehydrogenase 2, mitochondrial-like isoform X2 [Phragmites australis]|uniref:proline dehydrogenase 2, mitochondrial-like isoform X2 n=1 Tax=Phragmites australis TaxID=29695 RepID=UPI002D79578A|nr:proline dehydrogenase 2, mitochondrial-like isoform X2 [Phragmites australis]